VGSLGSLPHKEFNHLRGEVLGKALGKRKRLIEHEGKRSSLGVWGRNCCCEEDFGGTVMFIVRGTCKRGILRVGL